MAKKQLFGRMTLVRSYTAWCARCEGFEDFYYEPRKEAEKAARREGWKKTREGWVCPSCLTTEKLEKKAKKSTERGGRE